MAFDFYRGYRCSGASFFLFTHSDRAWDDRSFSDNTRAFAVRTRSDG